MRATLYVGTCQSSCYETAGPFCRLGFRLEARASLFFSFLFFCAHTRVFFPSGEEQQIVISAWLIFVGFRLCHLHLHIPCFGNFPSVIIIIIIIIIFYPSSNFILWKHLLFCHFMSLSMNLN